MDKSDLNLAKASKLGIIDETATLDEAIGASKVIILTIPVDGILGILPEVLDKVTDQVVIDMGSTKN